jgi:adenylosuccinate synthase
MTSVKSNSAQDENLKEILKPLQTLVVVGANWGDEGKGKVIDKILEHFDVAARFSGGANAGHTVFTTDGKKLVSHLIPCGLAQHKICVLSRGEFFNVELFLQELSDSRKILDGNIAPIYIDEQAPLWTPYHKLFEMYIELMRGENKIGTTNKGIGPLEGLYKLRLAPVVGHLFEPELLKKSLDSMYNVLKICLDYLKKEGSLQEEIPTPDAILKSLTDKAAEIKSFVTDTSYLLHESLKQGNKILFEGAQATGLDAWWGTYPFVSSGNSVAAGAALGTGLAMENFRSTILVAKTLPTRVGFGPMPSEMWDRDGAMTFAKEHNELFQKGEVRDNFLTAALAKINSGKASDEDLSKYFMVLGDERGATTGRGRSLGFLDIPWLLYAIRINQPKWLALTRFDMLSKVKSIPVVVGYKLNGQELPPGKIPPSWLLSSVETVKQTWPCWEEDISGINDFTKLPSGAQEFIKKLENRVGIPILLVGTGPGREALIVR